MGFLDKLKKGIMGGKEKAAGETKKVVDDAAEKAKQAADEAKKAAERAAEKAADESNK